MKQFFKFFIFFGYLSKYETQNVLYTCRSNKGATKLKQINTMAKAKKAKKTAPKKAKKGGKKS